MVRLFLYHQAISNETFIGQKFEYIWIHRDHLRKDRYQTIQYQENNQSSNFLKNNIKSQDEEGVIDFG